MSGQFEAAQIAAVDVAQTGTSATIRFVNAAGEALSVTADIHLLSEAVSLAQKERVKIGNEALHGAPVDRGDWISGPACAPDNFRAGNAPIAERPSVVVAFDLGSRWQLAYQLAPHNAEGLAAQLLAEAAKCRARPERPH